ncbi:MAG: hypothetical protein Q8R11_03515, partial [bacterium]|nr:hypothetical protein [bacterium]
MGNERIYTHQRQERQEEYATFLALPEIAPLHSDLESTRENLVAVTENVQMLKAEDSSKRADAQKQMTLLQEEIQRFSPATPSRLPRDPRKEIATGDTQAVKDRTRVLLGLVRTTHPLPLRLLARLLSRPHHPKLDVVRQELSDFERQLELETDTQADSLSKLEEQKVLFRNEFDLAEARFHDELLPWAAETPDRSALYGKLYSTRAIDAIQAYMQNCLDDLEPNDFLRYIHWTIGQVEENRWNQNVMHAFDAFLRPFFPGLVAEDIFSWKKEGGVEGVQGLLRAYFRPAELASIESAERPVDQETRV